MKESVAAASKPQIGPVAPSKSETSKLIDAVEEAAAPKFVSDFLVFESDCVVSERVQSLLHPRLNPRDRFRK